MAHDTSYDDAGDERDKCVVATNAAMEVAIERCSEGELLDNLTRMMGVDEVPDAETMPDELDAPDCMDMELVRGWVAVRSRELINQGEGVSDAISQAWDEAAEQCGW